MISIHLNTYLIDSTPKGSTEELIFNEIYNKYIKLCETRLDNGHTLILQDMFLFKRACFNLTKEAQGYLKSKGCRSVDMVGMIINVEAVRAQIEKRFAMRHYIKEIDEEQKSYDPNKSVCRGYKFTVIRKQKKPKIEIFRHVPKLPEESRI